MKNYLISYGVYFAGTFESHETRVKNCSAEWLAKAKLGEYVAEKYPDFERLEIYRVSPDLPDWFTNLGKPFPWLIFAGLMCLASCTKPEPPAVNCTVLPGTSTVHPIFKYPIRSDVLSVRVRFTASCLYAPLRVECAGDWNKLIYFGDANPHSSGAAIVWMPENDSIRLGWYCWLDGTSPSKSGRMGTLTVVQVGEWVMLQISLKSGIMWSIDGITKSIPDRIRGRWVTQGWFGGADNVGCDCNAVERVNYQIEIN